MLCEPSGASEGSVAWRWASAYKALGHEVEVFTAQSQDRFFTPEDLTQINVHFLGTEMNSDKSPHSVTQAFRLLGQILRWNRVLARSLTTLDSFDVVHHVSLSTIRVPSPLRPLGVKLIWGPLGGAHVGRLQGLQGRAFLFESIRNVSIWVSFLNFKLTGGFKRYSGLILATNEETKQFAESLGAKSVQMELSDGLTPDWIESRNTLPDPKGTTKEVSITWAGRLVASKRPDLAIKTLKRLADDGITARLSFYGEGPEKENLRALSTDLGVKEHVVLAGRKDPSLMPQIIAESDLCLFTSFRDSSSPLLLEALGLDVPCIAVRMQGVAACFPANLVPGPAYTSDETALVEGLAASARAALAAQPRPERVEFARTHVWENKALRVLELLGKTDVGINQIEQ